MAKRRRQRKRSAGEEVLLLIIFALVAIGLIISALAWLASVLWRPLLGLAVFAALAIGCALVVDTVLIAYASWRGQEPRRLRLTKPLVNVMVRGSRFLFGLTMHLLGWSLRALREPRIQARTLGELLMLSPSEFELVIAQSLRDKGYRNVKRRGGPGDLGVDITCHDPNGERVAVQCKRYARGRAVGSREIQLFIGMVTTHHPVDRGVIVTTSTFTQPARALAKLHPIRLIDGPELARIIEPKPALLPDTHPAEAPAASPPAPGLQRGIEFGASDPREANEM